MRSNLMSAMGISRSMQQARSLPHRPSRPSTAQTQHQEIESQADPSPPTPFSGDDADTQPAETGGSFASNVSSTDSKSGPSPKRARPRRSFKEPSPAKQRLCTNSTARALRANITQSTARKQPLLSVSANQTQKKYNAPKTPSKSCPKATADDLDESTFDGTELFAGTPGERMLDLEGAFDDNLENRY